MDIIRVRTVASKGYAHAHAFVAEKAEMKAADYSVSSDNDKELEVVRFRNSIERVGEELKVLACDSPIFDGHLTILLDFTLHDAVVSKIASAGQNAEAALQDTIAEFSSMFEAMDDEYMRERAADIQDVGKRLIMSMQNKVDNRFRSIGKPVIIIAEDLTPSDTARMDLKMVRGFITKHGGPTSHVSIIARSLEIPALVGVDQIMERVETGDDIALDAEEGVVYINPDEQSLSYFACKKKAFEQNNRELLAKAAAPAITKDGHQIKVYANAGSVEEIALMKDRNVDGVGLFRSEFLFMENTSFPSEEEQFIAYKQAVESLGAEITIRTLDIGGDKALCYFEFEKEENPFLGWRAIRMCLARKDVFRTQLRAILRASAFGKLRIMFPMIISLEELEEAVKLLDKCKRELTEENIEYDQNIEIGIMIETPAAVMCAVDLARHVSFFSIGTNDLTQYTLAVDRGNKSIESLYNPLHPAVLRSIKNVIDAAHASDVEVGICGEFASDARATKLLLGFGIDELSMAASDIPKIKDIIRNSNYKEAEAFSRGVLALPRVTDVEAEIAGKE